MLYAPELDDRRQEVRRGYASQPIYFWPKVLGLGNVAADEGATFDLLDPKGAILATAQATVAELVNSLTRFTCPVNATALELHENYCVVISWTSNSVAYVTSVRFDSVLEPWDGSDCSYNDLIEEVADLGELLSAQALAQSTSEVEDDEPDVPRTREHQASMLAMKACGDVKLWIKERLRAVGRIYPRLILQREDLRRVIAAQAVSRAYRAQGGGRDSPARMLAEEWNTEAKRRLTELGELDYDENEDREPDEVVSISRVVTVGRSWS